MKNQYFGDRRDFLKYELLLDLVECVKGRRLLLIPMLTPNDKTREGRLVNYSCGSRRQVLYECLRDAVASGNRDLRCLRTVMRRCRVRYKPYLETKYFDNATRTAYFKDVPTKALTEALVFLDPDVGLQSGTTPYMRKSGSTKYLMYAELSALWVRATGRSVFVVYQHLQKNAKRRQADLRRRLIEVSRTLETEFVWAVQWADLAFIVAVRDDVLATKIRIALAEHVRRHDAILYDAGDQRASVGSIAGSAQSRRSSDQVKSTPMANAPKMTTCKVQSGSDWRIVSIDDALALNEKSGRCIACGMPVRAHRKATNGMAAHFEHKRKNPTCRLSGGSPGVGGGPNEDVRKHVESAAAPGSMEVISLTVGDLAELKRNLSAVLDSCDVSRVRQGEGIRSRITRLSQNGGPIPRKIAAAMITITEFRNSAEHDSQTPTATQSALLRNAWQVIYEWSQSGDRGRK